MSQGRRYQVLGVLGKGGFGTVYKALLQGEGGFSRTVALKVLNPELAGMEDVARRLRDEARLLGLLRHRSILGVDGLVRLKGRWTVVMEYIEGADLGRISREVRFPLAVALEVVGEVASALHVAYTTPSPAGVPLNLLHRDIKPQNILLTAAGEIKVLDFGIARAEFSSREAKTQSVLYGSMAYMAPERLDFEELHEGDVYALGVVMVELLTGEPFGKASIRGDRHAKAVAEALQRVRTLGDDVPNGFLKMLGGMMSYEPEERPTAREVERGCRALRSQLDTNIWLRDWAETVVPEVMKGAQTLVKDAFSDSILVESKSLSDGKAVVEGTYFFDPESKEQIPKRKGWSKLVMGGSLAGCLMVGVGLGVGGMVLALLALLAVPDELLEIDDTAVADEVGAALVVPDLVVPDLSPMSEEAPKSNYGPPNGPSYRVGLSKPWSKMGLPVGEGYVTVSQKMTLVVMYGEGPLKPMVKRWEKPFVAQGYETTMSYDGEQACTRMMKKDSRQLTLAVVPSQGNLIVSISVR
jgi:serine/threonine protein kinase